MYVYTRVRWYESIDNKQNMCGKVNKDIALIYLFHSTPLHWAIQNIILAPNPSTAFLQKIVGRENILRRF